jgi:SAM-dependent methyltransferase
MRFETRYTYDFIKRFLSSECRRILEVGCGAGELAACLSKDGFTVVAIDSDPDSIAATRELGVDSRLATWPDFADDLFDAILFTQSLHHIHPLDRSVRHAADSLTDRGRIIVEDFAYDSADEKTLRWFRSAIGLIRAAGVLVEGDDAVGKTLSKAQTLEAWQQNHDHDLHTAAKIEAELEKTFGHIISENAAYYFRYVANGMVATDRRNAIVQAIAGQEETLAADGSIVALGRRFVAARVR